MKSLIWSSTILPVWLFNGSPLKKSHTLGILNGYPTYRALRSRIPKLLSRRVEVFRPDLLVLDSLPLLEALESQVPDVLKIPILQRITDVSFVRQKQHLLKVGRMLPFSNSAFTAKRVREHFGVESPVIYPFVDLACFRTSQHQAEYVTMINPVKKKGVDVMLEVARLMPERKFLIQEGWSLDRRPQYRDEFHARLRSLPNVEFSPWTSDLRPVYARTAVLLVPSQCEEAFGRVVLEAQVNGIPVIARDIGDLMCDSFLTAPDKSFTFNTGVFSFLAFRKIYGWKSLKTKGEKRVTH